MESRRYSEVSLTSMGFEWRQVPLKRVNGVAYLVVWRLYTPAGHEITPKAYHALRELARNG